MDERKEGKKTGRSDGWNRKSKERTYSASRRTRDVDRQGSASQKKDGRDGEAHVGVDMVFYMVVV